MNDTFTLTLAQVEQIIAAAGPRASAVRHCVASILGREAVFPPVQDIPLFSGGVPVGTYDEKGQVDSQQVRAAKAVEEAKKAEVKEAAPLNGKKLTKKTVKLTAVDDDYQAEANAAQEGADVLAD